MPTKPLPSLGRAAPPPGEGELARALRDFHAFLEAERGLSPRTVEAYGRDLRQLAAHLGAGAQVRQVTREAVFGFEAALYRQGVGAASVSRKVSAIRTFLAF